MSRHPEIQMLQIPDVAPALAEIERCRRLIQEAFYAGVIPPIVAHATENPSHGAAPEQA